jgi:hypothetical protein
MSTDGSVQLHKRFRYLCFIALVFCSFSTLLGRCENLTTLNGTTYTNITDIAKYQTVIVFTYCSNRTAVAISNLPEQFQLKYAITNKIEPQGITSSGDQSAQAQSQETASQTMSWLFGPRDSYSGNILTECTSDLSDVSNRISDKGWQICLNSAGWVTLTRFIGTTPTDVRAEASMSFHENEKDIISQVFKKFVDWDSIAMTNNAESFEKEIAGPEMALDSTERFTFHWDLGKSYLTSASCSAPIYRDDIIHFQNLLKQLSLIGSKLTDRIRSQENQKDLFK